MITSLSQNNSKNKPFTGIKNLRPSSLILAVSQRGFHALRAEQRFENKNEYNKGKNRPSHGILEMTDLLIHAVILSKTFLIEKNRHGG